MFYLTYTTRRILKAHFSLKVYKIFSIIPISLDPLSFILLFVEIFTSVKACLTPTLVREALMFIIGRARLSSDCSYLDI